MTAWILVHFLCGGDDAPKPKYEPTSAYEQQELLGWKLYFNKAFLATNVGLAERVRVHLHDHLYRIEHRLPKSAVVKLRKVPIWIEEKHPRHPCMCYHVSPDWLRTHDMNPEKAGSVEIANGVNFLSWTKDQPWMVLHELAHAYHDRFLPKGYQNPDVLKVYNAAKQSNNYGKVLHINGSTQKHYALTNQQEYFAEATESLFGTNDFHPFVRAEFQQFDPEGFTTIKRLWERR